MIGLRRSGSSSSKEEAVRISRYGLRAKQLVHKIFSNDKGGGLERTILMRHKDYRPCSTTAMMTCIIVIGLSLSHVSFAAEPKREILPIPEPEFNGEISPYYQDSTSDFPQPIKAPEGAPNILLIMLDDVGFGQASVSGGMVRTPNIQELADEGLKFTRFHTVGLCSPSRAALLTGRNHHEVGFGTIAEMSTGFPGYNTILPRDKALVSQVLRENGYSTSAFGKWHNTPDWLTTAAGPFDKWPTGLGFEYWYGFLGGETSQYEPQLFENTRPVEAGVQYTEGYHLTTDLVEKALSWLEYHNSVTPDKPYFMYFAPGAAHSPLHVSPEWSAKYEGQFDDGWDVYRERVFEQQKELGVIPKDAKLSPRPAEIPAWDEQSDDAKRVYARQMEVFAGFLAHADHEVGRLIDHVRSLPNGENTLILYVVGDNGPSPEGSMTGTSNNMMTQNGLPASIEQQVVHLDELGGRLHEFHYGVPWSWAGAAPFQWMKRVASHLGATRNSLVVSWPEKIRQTGEIRTQFHHLIDVVPTIYDAAGIPEPEVVDGIKQAPISGVSMVYAFNDKNAEDRHTTQYFETEGQRSIYHEGWMASAFHAVPWDLRNNVGDFESDVWELYNLEEDFSQSTDLASKHPQKLAQLKKIFDQEARKYSVYPLDDRWVGRALIKRPSVIADKYEFSYAQSVRRVPEGSSPPVFQRTHTITADLKIPKSGAEGAIVAQGGSSGGYSLFIKDGYLHYAYNFFGLEEYVVKSSTKVPNGEVTVRMAYEQTRPFKPNFDTFGGTAELFINDRSVGQGEIHNHVPARYSITETLDVGTDLGASVSSLYREDEPYEFTGTIHSVRYKLAKDRPTIEPR